MEKLKVGVVFGGMSTENEVSVVSASYVLSNLDKEKYEIYPIYIDKSGKFWEYKDKLEPREFGKKIEQKEKIEDLKGIQMDIAWGSQIRSYVFCPYTMVKDHRTNFEMGNITAVMDGDLDGFINAYLKMKSIESSEK